MDKINLKKLITSKESIERFAMTKVNLEQTGVTFKYSKPIHNVVTNYNKTVINPDWNLECVCDLHQEFIDKHHGHVLTGNLDIIIDVSTQKILSKGLNYRLKQPINKKKSLTAYQNSLDVFLQKLSRRKNVARIFESLAGLYY